MAINEAENDDVLVITCKFCGTQTRFMLNEAAGDETLKCRTCGAPLEAVPPPKKRRESERDYGMLLGDGCEERAAAGLNKAMAVAGLVFAVILAVALLLTARC